MKRASFWMVVVTLVAAGWLGSPAVAQQCNDSFCRLVASCTTCTVGQTINLELVCFDQQPLEEECNPELPIRCCQFVEALIPKARYVGDKKVNGMWKRDANCVEASNPLAYTFQSADVGEYRRKACRDSSCFDCSPEWTYITVNPS